MSAAPQAEGVARLQRDESGLTDSGRGAAAKRTISFDDSRTSLASAGTTTAAGSSNTSTKLGSGRGGLGRIRSRPATRQNSSEDIRTQGSQTPTLTLHANGSSVQLEDLESFPTTSLHSFSFAVQHDTIAARHNIVKRSIEYLREKLSGARSVSFHQDSAESSTGSRTPGADSPRKRASKPDMRLDLHGVNDSAFDPDRRPPQTAPPQGVTDEEFMRMLSASKESGSGRTSPLLHSSRGTTMTSATSNGSYLPPPNELAQVTRRRLSATADRYSALGRQLQASLSCTDLPGLSAYYQQSPLVHMHHNNRWGQQSSQAVFSTSLSEPWHIQSANDYAMMIFGIGREAIRKRTSLLDIIVEERREWLQHKLRAQLSEAGQAGQVLLCGDVLPVVKRLGVGAASLWIKERFEGLVWVIEEIEESVATITLDHADDLVTFCEGNPAKVFDRDSLLGAHVSDVLPTLPRLSDGKLDVGAIDRQANYGVRDRLGSVPCTVAVAHNNDSNTRSLRVSFLPHVAGIILVSADRLVIKSANAVFTSSLFGYQDLRGKSINEIIPQFEDMLQHLGQLDDHQTLDEGDIIPELVFRTAARKVAGLDLDLPLRGIESRHRDGSTIPIDLQMRIAKGVAPTTSDAEPQSPALGEERLYALWVSFEKGLSSETQSEVVASVMSTAMQATTSPAQPDTPSEPEAMDVDDDSTPRAVTHEAAAEAAAAAAASNVAAADQSAAAQSSNSNSSTAPEQPVRIEKTATPEPGDLVPHDIKNYQILEEMGAGAYGQVKLARYGRKRQKVVLKYVIKSRILVDTWTRDRKLGTVPLEIHVLSKLQSHPHRNLVEMKDFFEDEKNYYIVMGAHLPGMDLFDYIELNTNMDERECISISLQVARALRHLHELDIVHRDIKDENVVIDRSGWVKLIDFGSANYCRNGPFDTFHGTLDYASPEAIEGKPYTGKEQDVWACGILFYTLIYKENPFYNIDEIMDRDLRVPYIISDLSIDLIRRMLNRDVDARLTMQQVLDHGWYDGFVGDAIQVPVRIDIPTK